MVERYTRSVRFEDRVRLNSPVVDLESVIITLYHNLI